MMTGLAVLKMVLMPSRARLASAANSGPRWSMIAVSIARRTRSGMGVGPGICRKWRPTMREAFLLIRRFLGIRWVLRTELGAAAPARKCASGAGPQLAAIKDECESQSSLLSAGPTPCLGLAFLFSKLHDLSG